MTDTLARFHGIVTILRDGSTVTIATGAGRSEDLPADGFINRFALTIQIAVGCLQEMPAAHYSVSVGASWPGKMSVRFGGLEIILTPMDDDVRAALCRAEEESEIREQMVSVTCTHPGVYRVLIEERI